ncbi:MAG: hypothetical protein H3C64_03130 [Candidatus Kuenenia stuttgartiensis]|nr:hypothetical protein [Candidatus Kuenenia sp.]MBW7941397.1 hypothetical protein [Candidatus Kuenenia stuttgartiensis]MBZ0193341.1 hypothetical protein [Candidatus Kuenenia stuttgartiensis]MCF6152223.1 hypothetical protein [Candidatus Kuenenia stuttgartiensis]MCL4726752.1 hypothetical protein [Candidatus Kuenenia stuttgartiensis]MCZ7622889.1 hypothetical protein [Candidatus Kuenenia sp.]
MRKRNMFENGIHYVLLSALSLLSFTSCPNVALPAENRLCSLPQEGSVCLVAAVCSAPYGSSPS